MATHYSPSFPTPAPQPTIESRLITLENNLNTMNLRLSRIESHLTTLTTLPTPSALIQTQTLHDLASTTSPATSYILKFNDAGNNVLILPDDPIQRPVFKITTIRGTRSSSPILERTVVKLLPSSASASAGNALIRGEDLENRSFEGGVDWKAKRIKVGDISESLEDVKRNMGGPMSLETEWIWHSGTYRVTRNQKLQTSTVIRKEQELAIYTSFKVNGLEIQPASLRFIVDDIPNEERVFLILVLMFYDFQKTPIPESQSLSGGHGRVGATLGEVGINAAASVAANAAGAATANAVASCCVVQ